MYLTTSKFKLCVFEEKKLISPLVYHYRFKIPIENNQKFNSGLLPGQYICIKFGKNYERFYSVLSDVDCDYFDILVKKKSHKRESRSVSALNDLKKGEKLKVKIGGGFKLKINKLKYKHIGLICGGTGFSSCYQILKYIHKNKKIVDCKVTMVFGAPNLSSLFYREELLKIQKENKNINVHFTLDKKPLESELKKAGLKEWNGSVGFVDQKMVEKTMPKVSKDMVIILCGPFGMIAALKKILNSNGYMDNYYSYM